MSIPHRIEERIIKALPKYRQILQTAKNADLNEADTVSIIKDMLAELFGYDKYLDLTSELPIRSTFCDIAIMVDAADEHKKAEYLLEAKAIKTELKDNHLRQAVGYGASNGTQWIILTNGISWQLHRIRFGQPIAQELIVSFNFTDLDPKNEEHQDMLFLFCKEGVTKGARESFYEKVQSLNRFMVGGALILSDEVLGALRRELRKVNDGVLVDIESLRHILKTEVLKPDVIEGDEAIKAQSKIRRYNTKASRKDAVNAAAELSPSIAPSPNAGADSQITQ